MDLNLTISTQILLSSTHLTAVRRRTAASQLRGDFSLPKPPLVPHIDFRQRVLAAVIVQQQQATSRNLSSRASENRLEAKLLGEQANFSMDDREGSGWFPQQNAQGEYTMPRTWSAYSHVPRHRCTDPSPLNGRPLSPSTRPFPQSSSVRPLIRRAEQDWAALQERKVKVMGIALNCWTGDIYDSLCVYGTVTRIEMEPEKRCAWVTFQPPPQPNIYFEPIIIGPSRVRIEEVAFRSFFAISPVDPNKKYHEFLSFYGDSINFGVLISENTMNVMRTFKAQGEVRMALTLGDRKELGIQLPITIDGLSRKLRFRLPLSLIQTIYKVYVKETGQWTLLIPFDSPPQFFLQLKTDAIVKTCSRKYKTWIDWYSWYRLTDVVGIETRRRLDDMPVMNHKDAPIIDIGRWTMYRLTFNPATLGGPKYEEFSSALADYGVAIKDLEGFNLVSGTAPEIWSVLEEEISGTHPHLGQSSGTNSAFNDLSTGGIILSFNVRYQLEACLSSGYLKEQTITRHFLDRLVAMDAAQAVYVLEKVMDKRQAYFDPMDIFNLRVKGQPMKKIPSYCTLSRAVTITPTMLHVATPVVETSNRIIRKHAADSDRFIRVKFSDEKTEGPIYHQDDDRSNAVFNRIARAMNNGIVVAGRYYEFLAFGNSQFRENGAYFYAPTGSKSADDIRNSMGKFDHIKTVAKFGARLGQCFSTTRAIKSINVRINKIEDIERNGYCFTDGVGRISPFLAQMAAEELGLHNPFHDPPSLYQFRLGGCKGVLALDPKITGSIVHIRPSQYKFEAQNVGLEIIRASSLAVACFNRQLIIILSSLGVPDITFTRKQQEMVNYLERATKDEELALQKLQCNIDLNQTSLVMAGIILDGFMRDKEPFIMSLLQLWRAYHIKYLKEKARIIVENGAFLLGCVDETATLRGHYDDPQSHPDTTRREKLATLPEIFVQISDPKKKGHYKIIEGVCLLARNPSLHPGDMRVVRAVDVSALHHLKNVVVLPQTGDRDLGNMCSGGDLDGDDYIVLWDSDFLPEIINEPPMDFTAEKPVEQTDPITVQDMTNFFVKYMKNDSLRRIATSHLAQADFNDEGVRDRKCLELARLHSTAVDYPKSGIPAVMDRDLRPRKYPHFQENKYRPAHRIYKSTKILGKLYDQVQLVDFQPQYENAFDKKILDAFELSDSMLEEAADLKSSYDSALRRLMAKHAIRTEFEAWSVFVLSHNMESRDYTFAEEFGRTVELLKTQFRESCLAAVGATRSEYDRLAPFVAAMYTVTAREMEAALRECHATETVGGKAVPKRKMDPEHMPLISFPWLFVNELGKLKNGIANRQSVAVFQGVHRKHARKHEDAGRAVPGSEIGGIETAQGITQYGEVLSLDFDKMDLETFLKHMPLGEKW